MNFRRFVLVRIIGQIYDSHEANGKLLLHNLVKLISLCLFPNKFSLQIFISFFLILVIIGGKDIRMNFYFVFFPKRSLCKSLQVTFLITNIAIKKRYSLNCIHIVFQLEFQQLQKEEEICLQLEVSIISLLSIKVYHINTIRVMYHDIPKQY